MDTFTSVHVVISLVGIVTGFVVSFGMLAGKPRHTWTTAFLSTTLLTSVTGFFFPYHGFTPAIAVGVLSVVILVPVIYGWYVRKLAGAWRWIYVLGSVTALYLNFFVLIVQSFLKIPMLHALAPTQAEPPFAVAQGFALLFFVVLGFLATRKFKPPLRSV